jgi:hypothetical protein
VSFADKIFGISNKVQYKFFHDVVLVVHSILENNFLELMFVHEEQGLQLNMTATGHTVQTAV